MFDFDEVVDRKGTNCAKWDTIEAKNKPKDVLPMVFSLKTAAHLQYLSFSDINLSCLGIHLRKMSILMRLFLG